MTLWCCKWKSPICYENSYLRSISNNKIMDTTIYINNIEIILLVLSLFVLFFLALKNIKSVKISLILATLLLPALYLSIEGTTQFFTTDEAYIFPEVIHIHNSGMEQWYMSANRTSDAIIGSVLSLFQKYTYFTKAMNPTELKIFAKGLRWFVGFLLIIAIYWLTNKYYISDTQKSSYFIIYFYSVLSLPVSLIALKIANYDLLSMLLGILAIILLLRALQIKSDRHALVGIIISLLATQEKLIAYPILVFSLITFTYLKLEQSKNNIYKASFYYSFYAIFIAFVTSLTTFLIVAMVARDGHIPHISFSDVTAPIVNASAGIMRRLMIGGDFAGATLPSSFLLIFLTGFIISHVSLILIKIQPWLTNSFFPWLKRNMRLISIITIVMVFLVGVVGTYSIETVFISLFLPAQEGQYLPPYSFNNNTYYYDATNAFEYLIYSIAHAYTVFTNAIPSIYLFILFFIWSQKDKKEIFSGWEIVLLLALVTPLLYAITHTPFNWARYYNIFIFLVIFIIGLEFNKVLSQYSHIKKWSLISIFMVFLIIEILPFRPIFGSFRPIWNYSFNTLPSKGISRPVNWGWGDSVFIAGKKIEKMMAEGQIKNDEIRLYFPYFGKWINSNKAITIYDFTQQGIGELNILTLPLSNSCTLQNQIICWLIGE
ncbi:conserved hypothetical protein, membrane [Beggiatoa sp. PS]|nr:conserved hypothetical protein, membrane [Beggiatoa sp. PS]